MAALTGVMMMVAMGTFEWMSLKIINKMPKADIIVGILVALITIWLHNLALAVLIGVIISALVFAWESAKRIRARKFMDEHGVKHYEIYGHYSLVLPVLLWKSLMSKMTHKKSSLILKKVVYRI
jgi:SulP family sulfate permease